MNIIPFLRQQSGIKDRIRSRMNDTGATSRYSTTQIYEAINWSIEGWGGRVMTPFLYTITDGFGAGTRDYELPIYIDPLWMDVQWKHPEWIYNVSGDDSERAWESISGWEAYPDGDGTFSLRLDIDPPDTEARIIYYAVPGPIPVGGTLPSLAAGIDADDTTLTLNAPPLMGRNGHIIIGAEIMEFHGWTGVVSRTLTNLVRGTHGSTATTHAEDAEVEWMIPFHDYGLVDQLQYQTMAHLVNMNLTNPGSDGRARHNDNWNRWQSLADNYWRRHIPTWQPRKKIRMAAAGAPVGGSWMQSWWGRS